ncbi:MAG: hypothetical protein MZV70_47070 [Desulfobacterales bacterium]|nr:hypothetical protein [Desulfobacterales bacterium]
MASQPTRGSRTCGLHGHERHRLRLRVRDFPSLRGGDVPLLLHRTGGGSALDTLIRLFLVEVPCDLDAAPGCNTPHGHPRLGRGRAHHDRRALSARPAVKLLPYRGLFIAFDLPSRLLGDDRQDYVMGIGSSTLTLAGLTIRKPSRLTLDLGTGCGLPRPARCTSQRPRHRHGHQRTRRPGSPASMP